MIDVAQTKTRSWAQSASRWFSVHDAFCVGFVDLQSSGLTTVVDGIAGESTIFEVECNYCFTECSYNLIHVMDVLLDIFGENNYVAHIQ